MSATRKLAAIVFVDVVSYTAMMGKDEQATLRLLEKLRTVLYPLAQIHKGTVLKELGDGALMSFDSALEAVDCATNLQNGVLDIPNLKLRIGIHLGDVVAEEGDVFGSGVNVAARVQPLAVPGGIVVTEDVWKQIKNQPQISFVSLGPRRLKGVGAPVKVFALKREGLAVPSVKQRIASHPAFRKGLIASALLVFVVLSYLFVPEVRQLTAGEVPSIAILYLKNLGPETDEPYTYGITQDLIVDIAKAGLIRVVPMKDILTFQKTELTTEKIADQLRVRYVMEGSLHREVDLFRLTAHIIEATTGKTLWADRIQTKVAEAAALQGQLAQAIISALRLKPSETVAKSITKARTADPEAYEYYLRAKYLFDKKKTKDDVAIARGLYEKALGLDSNFVRARLGLGNTYFFEGDYARSQSIYENALRIAQSIGSQLDQASCLLNIGKVRSNLAEYSQAIEYFNQSLRLFEALGDRDGQSRVFNNMGNAYYAGARNYDKAIDYWNRQLIIAKELNDKRQQGDALNNIAVVYNDRAEYEKALEYLKRDLKITQELGYRSEEGMTLSNIGMAYQGQGDYSSALATYLLSLAISRELRDRKSEEINLHNIGNAHYSLGNYPSALDSLAVSLQIGQELGDRFGEANTLMLIGAVYQARKDLANAITHHVKSLKITREIGDPSTQAYAVGFLGTIHFERGEHESAADSLRKAIEIFDNIGEKQNALYFLSFLCLTEAKLAKRKLAEETANQAEQLLQSVSKSYDTSEIMWNLSQSYSLLGNTEKASRYLEQAYRKVTSRAEKISDTVMRKSYLQNVKENREIIAAWEKQLKTEGRR